VFDGGKDVSRARTLSRAVFIGLLVAMAAGCTSTRDRVMTERRDMVAGLCEFGTKRESTLITHLDNQGGTISGDVRQVAVSPTWASALATTREPVAVIVREVLSVVAVPQCNYWGYCGWVSVPVSKHVTSRESLEDIYGLGRVPVADPKDRDGALEDAENLALENCEAMAENFAEGTPGISEYDEALDCVVLSKRLCR
jgi:hypothetical protein